MIRCALASAVFCCGLAVIGCAATDASRSQPRLWNQTRAQVALQLADEHMREGDFERARSLLAAHGTSSDARLQLALAQVDLEEGRYAAALRRVDDTPPEDHEAGRCDNVRAVAYEGLGRWDEAAATYERAYQHEPTTARLVAWLDTLVLAGRADEARAVLDAQRSRFPGEPEIQALAIRLYQHTGDTAAAIDELQAALVHTPESAVMRGQLADAYMRAGRHREAAALWRELAASAQGGQQRGRMRHKLAICLLADDEFEDAVRTYRILTLTDPDDVRAHLGLAAATLASGAPVEAIAAAQRALRLDPGAGDARLALACAYAQSGQRGKAVEVLEARAKGAEADPLVRELLARWRPQPVPESTPDG